MKLLGDKGIALVIGLLFTFLGGLKLYGFCRGYEGGPGLPFWVRLRAGSCAEGHCKLPALVRKPFYLSLWLLWLAVGLFSLTWFFITIGR
jgi:protein-S-isoprenylcysteine O-methyltransferase Ste14